MSREAIISTNAYDCQGCSRERQISPAISGADRTLMGLAVNRQPDGEWAEGSLAASLTTTTKPHELLGARTTTSELHK